MVLALFCMNFPVMQSRLKLYHPFQAGVTSSTHEFHMLRNHTNSQTPPPTQLAAEMTLPRIACVALLLNLTMNLGPVSQLHESHDSQQAYQ